METNDAKHTGWTVTIKSKTKYKIGTGNPKLPDSKGAGIWNSKPATTKMLALKNAMQEYMPFAHALVGDDAAKHLTHYLENSGKALKIDFQGMLNENASAEESHQDEVDKVKKFARTLPVGTHNITTDTVQPLRNGFKPNESKNWFYAVGAYYVWIKGVVKIEQDKSGRRRYRLDYEYNFADRYDWHDFQIILFNIKIKDKDMGEFHLQGIAQEFKMHGSIKASIEW